jgi:outer membrane protein OmpA-like peptidoglycan-associated protein
LVALGVLGLALYFWPKSQAPVPVAQAPAVAPAPALAPALLPPRLAISNDDGVIHVSGSVRDEETKNTIFSALKSVFGADKVQGDIAVDLNRGPAPWLVNFRNGVEALKAPGVQAVFDGNSVNLDGGIAEADLNRITASMRSVLGGSLVFSSLVNNAALEKAAADKAAADKAAADKAAADKAAADKAAADKAAADKAVDTVVRSDMKAAGELASLKSESAPSDLIAALNDAIVNFPSGSAEVPASITAFLQSAAHHLTEIGKQLPAGTELEIAGYTDNSGDPAANVALSQKRADAVRDAMIKAGANSDMLIAKGYGEADPVASNDTPDGRFRNRRIEYRLVKAP